jgi:hypothetical protein
MSLNSLTVKKFLLTAGLLLVLGQGLCQLPELRDFLFPVDDVKLILGQASKECPKVEGNLTKLHNRLEYLKWFQTHNGPDQKISADRLLSFPFSECIRPLAPRFFWHINIILAHKNRRRAEGRLRYLDAVLKGIAGDFRLGSSHASPAIPAETTAVSSSMEQIHQCQNQCKRYNSELKELSKQLAWLENNGYKK